MRRILRWTSVAVVVGGLGSCASLAALNYSGYCFAQGRYLSDEELIRASIEGVLGHYRLTRFVAEEMPGPGRPVPSSNKTFRASDAKGVEITADQLIAYSEAEEFMTLNPGCCSFARQGLYGEFTPPSFAARISGYSRGYFNARYQIRYRDAAGQVQSRWTGTTFHFTNCGHGTQYPF